MSKEKTTHLIRDLQREIRAAQVAVGAVDQAVAERLGINATDHRCMDILDQRGPSTAGALAKALHLSPSAVTTVIDRLERLRYVRRTPNPDDRRQVVIILTPLLRRRMRELYGDGQEVLAALERYSAEELALLRDFCRQDRELNERRAERLARPAGGRRRARQRGGGEAPGGEAAGARLAGAHRGEKAARPDEPWALPLRQRGTAAAPGEAPDDHEPREGLDERVHAEADERRRGGCNPGCEGDGELDDVPGVGSPGEQPCPPGEHGEIVSHRDARGAGALGAGARGA